ncbi:DUF4177 domain-containing protein [Sphingobacterium hungaricum]
MRKYEFKVVELFGKANWTEYKFDLKELDHKIQELGNEGFQLVNSLSICGTGGITTQLVYTFQREITQ